MSKSTDDLIRELEASHLLSGPPAAPPARVPASAPIRKRLGTSHVVLLVVAAVLIALIGSLPFGSLALYPFGLFVTLLHETGHAISAVISGGSVASLQIRGDQSGVTGISGGLAALEASAGYLGATAAGVALLLTPLRYARWALAACAAVPLAVLLLFHPATLFTAVWCGIFAAAFGLAAWKLPPRFAGFLQMFLGVEAGLNAFRDLMTLIFISGSNAHIQTDADAMSSALFLPPIVWAVIWTSLSLLLIASALLVLLRRDAAALPLPRRRPVKAT